MLFDPFAPFDQLTRTVARSAFLPPADVTVSDGDVVLTMDLPGLTAEDLQLEVLDGHLVVRGERRRPEVTEGTRWTHSERTFGAFERRLRLPDGVDPDRITASMDNGVLSLIVPKPERMRPRAIQIQSGGQRELAATTA